MSQLSHRSQAARTAIAIAIALPCSMSLARAEVRVVGSGGQYTTIQAAINAAVDGDTILARLGTYSSFVIDNKALAVVNDAPNSMSSLTGQITVRNVALGKTVILSGFSCTGVGTSALQMNSNAGFVRITRCTFRGANGNGNPTSCMPGSHDSGWEGAILQSNGGGVAFAACVFEGGRGIAHPYLCYETPGGHGGHGLHSTGSRVAVYDCSFLGGLGADGGLHGGNGGSGAYCVGGLGLMASNSNFAGQHGGDGLDFTVIGGSGGHGVFVGSGAAVQLIDCTGQLGLGGEYAAPDGVPFAGSPYYTYSASRIEMQVPSVAREGTNLPLTIRAQPGDEVFLSSSRETVFDVMPSWSGVLLANQVTSPRIMILGSVPPSGILNVTLSIPDQGPGFSASTRFLQVLRRSSTGQVTLGSFATVTVLDSVY